MSFLDHLFGRRLATFEEGEQRVGVLAGIPMLGLDALGSAVYGPEAALSLLIPLGAAGLGYIGPISTLIIILLAVVYLSYRQTIAAYPHGGGSYTVARENLGTIPGLFAASALLLDYVLVVAVGIAAGVAALVSAIPQLHSHTLSLCLGILVFITLINLRGVRESGAAFMAPTYLFIVSLLAVLAIGIVKSVMAGGHPTAVEPVSPQKQTALTASLWILMRAFASGCTAMTGVEAVSNGVSVFKDPAVDHAPNARRDRHTAGCDAGGHRVFVPGLWHRRDSGVPARLSEHPVSTRGGRDRQGSLVLHHNRLSARRARTVGQYGLRRFPPALPRDRPGRLPAQRICPPGPPTRVFPRHHRTGLALRSSLDRLRRDHQQSDPPVRRRRVSRIHAVAGRHGRALAQAGRTARRKIDADQWRRRGVYGGHTCHRHGLQVR